MNLVDLHTHSTASDGSDSPERLVARAAEKKLSAVALTDHDTVAGLAPAGEAAGRLGVELVRGIEISAKPVGRAADMHVLGYFIDPASAALGRLNEWLLAARAERNEKLLRRLAELTVPVERAELEAISDGVITRAHFAEVMLRRRYVASPDDAFRKYLGVEGAAYIDKGRPNFGLALDTIHGAGGLAVLAHPVHLRMESDVELEVLVGRLTDSGLDGIEAFHPDHSPAWARKVQLLARRFGLCVTGGSDYHGLDRVARPLGCQRVDGSFLEGLKERLAARPASRPAAK